MPLGSNHGAVFKLEQQQRPAENQERGLDLQHFISSCKNNVSLLPYTLVYLISMQSDLNICESLLTVVCRIVR